MDDALDTSDEGTKPKSCTAPWRDPEKFRLLLACWQPCHFMTVSNATLSITAECVDYSRRGGRRRRALKQTVYWTVKRPSSSWRRAPIKRLDQIHEYRHQWWISALWITQDINLQRHRPILNSWLDVFADASSSAQSSSSTLRFFEVL